MPEPTWTLDGFPIHVDGDWQASQTADGGHRDATVRTGASKMPPNVDQESILAAWRDDGGELWQGILTERPYIKDGIAEIHAVGPVTILSRQAGRLLYQSRGAEEWTPADGDVFSGTDFNTNKRFESDTSNGRLYYKAIKGENFNNGDMAPIVWWSEGSPPTKITFQINKSDDNNDFDLDIHTFSDPLDSSGTSVASYVMSGANPSGTVKTETITDPEDVIRVRLKANTGGGSVTPLAEALKITLTQIKVWGRTQDDEFSASQVMADVFAEVGYDTTGVQSSGLNVLPLDWTDDWPSLIDYMSDLTDWWYRIGGKTPGGLWRAEAGPAERVWTAYRSEGADSNLQPLPKYNKVIVPYETRRGLHREAVARALDDPFPDSTVPFYADDLEDPQSDDLLADTVASTLVEKMSGERVRGQVTVTRAHDDSGRDVSPYELKAGDLLYIADHDPLLPAQRIQAITYNAGGVASLDIEEEVNISALLAFGGRGGHRKHHRKRKHRKHKNRR